jgi:hypothetical protein
VSSPARRGFRRTDGRSRTTAAAALVGPRDASGTTERRCRRCSQHRSRAIERAPGGARRAQQPRVDHARLPPSRRAKTAPRFVAWTLARRVPAFVFGMEYRTSDVPLAADREPISRRRPGDRSACAKHRRVREEARRR